MLTLLASAVTSVLMLLGLGTTANPSVHLSSFFPPKPPTVVIDPSTLSNQDAAPVIGGDKMLTPVFNVSVKNKLGKLVFSGAANFNYDANGDYFPGASWFVQIHPQLPIGTYEVTANAATGTLKVVSSNYILVNQSSLVANSPIISGTAKGPTSITVTECLGPSCNYATVPVIAGEWSVSTKSFKPNSEALENGTIITAAGDNIHGLGLVN